MFSLKQAIRSPHGAAVDRLARVRQRQRQAPVDQTAEQQIEIVAILLDVGYHVQKPRLRDVGRVIIDVLHIAVIEFEDPEPYVQIGGVEGHLVDREANSVAMRNFLYTDEVFEEKAVE